ncbi:MAG: pyridoxamine 5'-phosphate oxidase family protein [Anaerolineae bacterium]|nr:pyridoxamine 5'-phosphate oxidase family protein [Anaerolineae bacterium]
MVNNPAGWPAEVLSVFERSVTCEFATLTRKNTPVTFPLTPYIGEDGLTIDVSTGLSYPAKAERARRNPQVAVLFSDPVGAGLTNPPVVLVQGVAAVRDTDLQANTDRYVRLALAKFPAAYRGVPGLVLRRSQWYFTRIWILVTPLRIRWWPDGNMDAPPQEWTAPADTPIRKSDVAPAGKQPPPWTEAPADWHEGARHAEHTLGVPVLTIVGDDGYPVPFRVRKASTASDGFWLDLPSGIPAKAEGPASLTFHKHAAILTGQENVAFVGTVEPTWQGAFFRVERQLADFSLKGGRSSVMMTMLRSGQRLAPRLRSELRRRNQPMPKINLPEKR